MANSKKKFLTGILFAFLINQITWAQNTAEFTLHITKEGGMNDSVRILYLDGSDRSGDSTIFLHNGSATYLGAVKRATEAVLFTKVNDRYLDGPYVIRFILEPGQMNLAFKTVNDTVQHVKITGSKSQIEKENWELANAPLFDEEYHYSMVYKLRQSMIDKNPGLEKLYKVKIDSLNEKRTAAAIAFIKANPNSYYSAYLLRKFVRSMPLDSTQVYFTSLSNRVKESQLSKDVLKEVFARSGDMNFRKLNSDPVFFNQLEKIKSFHDISLPDITGQVHHLSKLKGKYVVIDFWGSWCGPCFANIPHLKKLVADMKGKPVEFVSISIDKNISNWKKAMAIHHFPGLNLVDTAGLAGSFYKVPWVPKYVIINPDGTVASEDAPFPISGELKPLLLSIMDKKD